MHPRQQTLVPGILSRIETKEQNSKQIPLFGNLIKREDGKTDPNEDIIEMAPRVDSDLVTNFGFHSTSRRKPLQILPGLENQRRNQLMKFHGAGQKNRDKKLQVMDSPA